MKYKKFSNGYFDIDSLTDFVCPECNIGLLEAKKENIVEVEHKKHNELVLQNDDYEMDWFKNDFCGFLQCNNSKCNESIVVAGKMQYNEFYSDYEGGVLRCYPEYFGRPIHIIELLSEYPEEIKEILIESFSLFWLDKSSCANRIRVCIEAILDRFDIEKISSKGGFIALDTRIKEFAKEYDDFEEILLAIKWIGNQGSHSSVNVGNLLDCYRLADYMLKKLFKKEEKSEIELSKEVNKVKGRNRT